MKLKLVLSVAIAFFAVLFGFSLWGTSQPNFCLNCHEMKNYYASWSASSHSRVSCTTCHVKSGPANFIIHKASALREVAVHFTSGYSVPINKDGDVGKNIPSDNCITCHRLPPRSNFGTVIFPHNEHDDVNCAYCHNRVAHPNLEGYKDRTQMETCISCHKNKGEPVTCNTCHSVGVTQKPASHLTGNWIAIHDNANQQSCKSCHDDAFCSDCHNNPKKIPASHKASSWSTAHEAAVNTRCATQCHKQSFCDNCHRGSKAIPASHKAGNWIERHEDSANSSCTVQCHQKQFCDNCHRTNGEDSEFGESREQGGLSGGGEGDGD